MTAPYSFITSPDRACARSHPDLFFEGVFQEKAMAICEVCPFQTECRDYALDTDVQHGIWAGIDFSSRKARDRARKARGVVLPKAVRPRPVPVRISREQTDSAVRTRWERGLSDGQIALQLDLHPGAVQRIRSRLGLQPLFGPRGKRVSEVAA